MAEIEIAALGERLADDEIVELSGELEHLGAPPLPKPVDDASLMIGKVDDEAMAEFMDRLEAHDLACEIFLPMEFEGRAEVADLRVGSVVTLLEVLEELRDELAVEDDEDEDEEEDEADAEELIMDAKLRVVWKLVHEGAQLAVDRRLPLHIQS